MSYRTKARRLATNNREYKNLSLDGLGKCKYCPPHKGDNDTGNRSQWGKKVAAKTLYATGKGRKELPKFMRKWYDKHYDPEYYEYNRKLDSKYEELDKGYLLDSLEDLSKYLKVNKNKVTQDILEKVCCPHSSGTIYLSNNKLEITINVRRKRKTQNYYQRNYSE